MTHFRLHGYASHRVSPSNRSSRKPSNGFLGDVLFLAFQFYVTYEDRTWIPLAGGAFLGQALVPLWPQAMLDCTSLRNEISFHVFRAQGSQSTAQNFAPSCYGRIVCCQPRTHHLKKSLLLNDAELILQTVCNSKRLSWLGCNCASLRICEELAHPHLDDVRQVVSDGT